MRCDIHLNPETGNRIITCSPDCEILKAFLETEIQDDQAYAGKLYSILNATDKTSFEISGNLFNLQLLKDKFIIENLFNDTETLNGPRRFLIDILRKWINTAPQK